MEELSGAGLWVGVTNAARRKLRLGSEYTAFALSMCRCCKAEHWCSMRVGLGIRHTDIFGELGPWTQRRYVTVGSGELAAEPKGATPA